MIHHFAYEKLVEHAPISAL